MAKILFEFSLEKFTFKLEGEHEIGQDIQQALSSIMAGLSTLRARAQGHNQQELKPVQAARIEGPAQSTPKRRKRVGTAGKNTSASPATRADKVKNNGRSAPPKSRRTPNNGDGSLRELVMDLRRSGFFSKPRTVSQVAAELEKRGHSNVRQDSISRPLKFLSTKRVLTRDLNTENKWAYSNGSHKDL